MATQNRDTRDVPTKKTGCAGKVTTFFTTIFQKLGRSIGRNPWKLIFLSILVTAGLGCGMITMTTETDTETLYTPINSRASKDRSKVNSLFPDKSGTTFNSYALTNTDRFGEIIVSSPGSNVLNNDTVEEIIAIIDGIKSISITYSGVSYAHNDLCAQINSTCVITGENILPGILSAFIQNDLTYPKWKAVELNKILGNVKYSSGKVLSAQYMRITFHLRQDNASYLETAKSWENQFVKDVPNIKAQYTIIHYSTSQSLNDELNHNTGGDIKFFSITFTLMITYATIVAGGDALSSRTWASWAGVMAAGFGIISAFGLISACGLKFVQIVGVMPFLIIGIGVDDMFLFMSSWVHTYPSKRDLSKKQPAAPGKQKQESKTSRDGNLRQASPALDFNQGRPQQEKGRWIGSSSQVNVSMMNTFYTNYDPNRMQNNILETFNRQQYFNDRSREGQHHVRNGGNYLMNTGIRHPAIVQPQENGTKEGSQNDLKTDPTKPPIEERMGRMFGTAGIGITITSLTDLLAFAIGSSSVFVSVRNFCVYTGVAVIFCYLYQCLFFSPCLSLHGKRVESNRHCITCLKVKKRGNKCSNFFCWGTPPKNREDDERLLERLPRQILPKLLLNRWGKIIVFILYFGYLGVSIWGMVNFKQGLDLKNLVSSKSYYYSYSEISNTYYETSFPVPFIFEKSTDYISTETVKDIKTLLDNAKNDQGVNPDSQICWLFSYMETQLYKNNSLSDFIQGLKTFISFQPMFDTDVVFDSSGNNIEASRCYLFSSNIRDSNSQADVMTRMRKLSDDSPLSVYVFHPAFIFFEQYAAILPSTLQTVGVAIVVMFVVTCVFMPHPLMVVLVVLNILSILVGIFGFLYIWDLSLSSITMIHLIMSVGFSVDFSVHVCSAYFMEDPNVDEDGGQLSLRARKTKTAIIHAAGPILNGAISSFLGIIVLVFSESYIFSSFFKIMFTVILFGMLHAVFLLPVVLSVLGPLGSTKPNRKQSQVASTSSWRQEQDRRPPTPPPDYD